MAGGSVWPLPRAACSLLFPPGLTWPSLLFLVLNSGVQIPGSSATSAPSAGCSVRASFGAADLRGGARKPQ